MKETLLAVVLDTGPLGLLTHPKPSSNGIDCRRWLEGLKRQGALVIVPEIADYELRRELLRSDKPDSITLLDVFCESNEYLAITTKAMRHAAEFWAQGRREGRPTAPDLALDGDVILAGQVVALGLPSAQIVVATTNVAHIARFVPAKNWNEIKIGTVGEE